MRPSLVLLAHSFRRSRALVLGMGVVLAAFQVLASLMAASFQQEQLFTRIAALVPPYVRQALGSSFITMMSFTGIVAIGYVHFAVIGSLVGLAIAVGTEPASEVERGFSDLLMARPMARYQVVTRSVLLLLAAATVTNLMMVGGTYAGLALFAPADATWPPARMLLQLAALLWLLMWCWGGVALAFGAAAKRRGVAGAGAGVMALALFLFDVVARVWKPASSLGRLSPFHYFNPIEIVSGRPVSLGHFAVLAAIGLSGIAVAYTVYARRDL